MPWSTPTSSGNVVAIHAALMPTANGDGEIVLIGGDNHDLAASERHDFDHAARFNCRQPDQAVVPVHLPNFDLFCCGHSFLGDGRLLVAGGTSEFPPDAPGPHAGHHFDGHRHCAIYTPATGLFTAVADMGPQPGHGDAGGGRWYPTLCTLGNGEVYAFEGHPSGTDTRHGNDTPERYSAGNNTWAMLPKVGEITGDPILYPRMHLMNDGHLFVTSNINGHSKNIRIDPFAGSVEDITVLPDAAYFSFDFPSVLLPLVPTDGYRARILLCGAALSQFIDFGNIGAGWQAVSRDSTMANRVRKHSCATLLPTGDVLLTGGADPNTDQSGVMQPEIYRTPLNRTTHTYLAGTGHWETINESATVLRNYHSTALLMPDGRVWTAGGNSAQQPGAPPTAVQKQIEIFDPPYPAGPRPVIASAPVFVPYGDEFEVRISQASSIASAVLMRCGSSTHAFNPDQRAIYMAFRVTAPDTLALTTPPNGNIAPPGPYMLFVVDTNGRPCQYAAFVQLNDMPDDGSRYAAIWVKDDGAPFVAHHGMTAAQYQQQFDQLVGGQGFVLSLVNGHTVGGQDRYSAIWEKRPSPAFIARHGLTSQAYQQAFDDNVRQGFRLTLVSGYEVAGQARYAAIWEKSGGPAWEAHHGMSSQQYQQTFDQLVGQGYRLRLVNGYSVSGQELFAAIWQKDGGPAFVARHGLTSQQYQVEFDNNVRQGFRLIWVSCYRHANEERYAGIWEKSSSPPWVARHGFTSAGYQHEFNHWVGIEGYRLRVVSAC